MISAIQPAGIDLIFKNSSMLITAINFVNGKIAVVDLSAQRVQIIFINL